MTVRECLEKVHLLAPSVYGDDQLLRWLWELDARIWDDLISRCEGAGPRPEMYRMEQALDIRLPVPAPYDELYLYWLRGKIDFANGEADRFNNDMMMYQSEYADFAAWWIRKHMPLQTGFRGARGNPF